MEVDQMDHEMVAIFRSFGWLVDCAHCGRAVRQTQGRGRRRRWCSEACRLRGFRARKRRQASSANAYSG